MQRITHAMVKKIAEKQNRAFAADIRAGVPDAPSLRCRLSYYSYSKSMAPLLFGGPHSSQGHWFGLRRSSWLLFHLYCRTLRTFATEALGKLAAIIRVNLGVVLGSSYRHMGEAVVNQEFALLCVHVD
jgi:hypothetical protein